MNARALVAYVYLGELIAEFNRASTERAECFENSTGNIELKVIIRRVADDWEEGSVEFNAFVIEQARYPREMIKRVFDDHVEAMRETANEATTNDDTG